MGRMSPSIRKWNLRHGLWSPDEDEKLFNHILRYGVGSWRSVPKLSGLQRCGKSCRLRWLNYLRPDLKRGPFQQHEEDLIISLHQALGNRWAQIASRLPGRTDNGIKNFWNSCLKKKLLKKGINPDTHQPLTTNNEIQDQKMISADASTEVFTCTSGNGIPFSLVSPRMVDFMTGHDPADLFQHTASANSSSLILPTQYLSKTSVNHATRIYDHKSGWTATSDPTNGSNSTVCAGMTISTSRTTSGVECDTQSLPSCHNHRESEFLIDFHGYGIESGGVLFQQSLWREGQPILNHPSEFAPAVSQFLEDEVSMFPGFHFNCYIP